MFHLTYKKQGIQRDENGIVIFTNHKKETMKTNFIFVLALIISGVASAQKYGAATQGEITKEWNSTVFSSEKSFAENIKLTPNFSILSKALGDEALLKALENEEMVTIFAITDSGFSILAETTRDSIIGNPRIISSIIKLYTIPGRVDNHSLKRALSTKETVHFATLNGETLSIKEVNGNVVLFDSKNNTATIIASDFYHKNGFFHIVDGVIFPAGE